MRNTLLLTILACLACGGCGFHPVYGNFGDARQADIQSELSQIKIGNIPDRKGQMLRNELIDRFYKNARPVNPNYLLKVSEIKESKYDLDITISSDATRAQLTLATVMELIDNKTGESVLKRSIKSAASYNIMESEFATRVSEQNTRENALSDLARQIELQTALFFRGFAN